MSRWRTDEAPVVKGVLGSEFLGGVAHYSFGVKKWSEKWENSGNVDTLGYIEK